MNSFDFWQKFLAKIRKRLAFHRLQRQQGRPPSFHDLVHFLQHSEQKGHMNMYKKVGLAVIAVLLLATSQLNFMYLTTRADNSIDNEYFDYQGIYVDKPMMSNAAIDTESTEYVVQPGDTIESLTEKFQISASTIINNNDLKRNAPLEPGKKLTILPVTGLLHTVKKNDSLALIADTYQVPQDLIMYQNNISSNKELKVGDQLIIPNGAPPVSDDATPTRRSSNRSSSSSSGTNGGYGNAPSGSAPETGGTFTWPASCIVITQPFSPRIPHWGIDCANHQGTPVYAAGDGTVIKASVGTWGGGYGNHVIIDHGNGINTIYGHLFKVGVSVGDVVKRGQGIGLMGTTGRSTGPHLHFEVVVNGKKSNPMSYL